MSTPARTYLQAAKGKLEQQQTPSPSQAPQTDASQTVSSQPNMIEPFEPDYPELPAPTNPNNLLAARRERLKTLVEKTFGVKLQFPRNTYTVNAGTELFVAVNNDALVQYMEKFLLEETNVLIREMGKLKGELEALSEAFSNLQKKACLNPECPSSSTIEATPTSTELVGKLPAVDGSTNE